MSYDADIRTTNNPRHYSAPEGRTIIVIGPYCWGKASTGKEALKLARSSAIRVYHPKMGEYHFFDAPASAYVNDMGGINCPADSARPVEIGVVKMPKPR